MVGANGFLGRFFLPPPPPPLAESAVEVEPFAADVLVLPITLTEDGRKEKELTLILPLSVSAERKTNIVASPIIFIPILIATRLVFDISFY